MPEAPNHLICNDRPSRTDPQTALSKLAAGWLQRHFAALLQAGTRRLNTTYIVAGLIHEGTRRALRMAPDRSGISLASWFTLREASPQLRHILRHAQFRWQ